MALDALSLVLGLAVGGSAVALAGFLLGRRPEKAPPSSQKLTGAWRLREYANPVVVAHDVTDLDVPPGATIYASGSVSPAVLAACTVYLVPTVRTRFALEPDTGRALLFTGHVEDGQLALQTSDAAIVERLRTEWRTLESRRSEYVERLRVADLAGKAGVTVETQGLVQEVLPYKDRFMMRLEDQGAIIGVLVDRDPESLQDERVRVRGALEKQDGYLVLEATDVRRLR